ncbi:MAG: autotransporter-associated beta strand repeat-containing protein [Bacteroidia bacterium]
MAKNKATAVLSKTGLVLLACFLFTGLAFAQTPIVSTQSGNWDQPSTWFGGVVPTASDPVVVSSGHTVTLVANTSINTLLTVNGTLALATRNMTAGGLAGSGFISTASGSPQLTIGSLNTNTAFTGRIGPGAIAFIKNGTGRLELTFENTYTGATTINAGSIRITNPQALGTSIGSVTINDAAALELSSLAGFTFTRPLGIRKFGPDANGAILNVAGDNILSNTVTLNDEAGIGCTGGSLTLSATTSVTGATWPLYIRGTQAISITGNITTTTGALFKQGTNTLSLSGASTFSGGVNLEQGVILARSNGALSNAGTVTVSSGATLRLENDITIARPININGNGVSSGGAIRQISGSNIISATITMQSGARIQSDGGLLTLSNATSVSAAGFNLTFSGSGNMTISGNLALTAGSVTKIGNGTTTFMVANTYTGGTTMSAGAINIRNANALGTTGTIEVTSGGTLQLEGGITFSRAITINGNGTGNNGAIRGFGGSNTISSTISLSGNARIYSDNGGTLTLSNTTAVSGGGNNLSIGGNNDINVNGNLNLGSGSLTKLGNGTVILTVSNSFTGGATVSGGALRINNQNRLGSSGDITITSGGLQITGGITISRPIFLSSTTGSGGIQSISGNNTISSTIELTNNARINADAGTLTLSNANSINATNRNLWLGGAGNMNVQGTITIGTGNLTKDGSGTVTLQVPNTYTGTTNVSAGTLVYGTNDIIFTGDLNVNGGTLNIGPYNDEVGIISISGSGSIIGTGTLNSTAGYEFQSGSIDVVLGGNVGLTKTSTGTLTLTAANTFTGQVWIQQGTLIVSSLNRVVGGNPSSNLGAPTTVANGTIRMGNGNNTATLRYEGPGETTDRVFELAGTTGLIIIQSAGTGGLTLNGNFNATGAGSKTLRFDGANTGTQLNTINGQINNASPTHITSLDFRSQGNWLLPNANSFTGRTDLSNNTRVIIRHNHSLGINPDRTRVNTGAMLELWHNGTPIILTQTIELNGTGLSYAGALISTSGNNRFDGEVLLDGTVRITTAADSVTFNGSPFSIGVVSGSRTLTIDNAGAVSVMNEFWQGPGTSIFTKIGTGNLHLYGQRTSAGEFRFDNGGVLYLWAEDRNPNSVIRVNTARTVELNGFSQTFVRLSSNNGNSIFQNSGALCILTINNDGGSATHAGRIFGNISLVVTGTGNQTLSNNNATTGSNFTGSVHVSGGSLTITRMLNTGDLSSIGTGTTNDTVYLSNNGEFVYNGSTGNGDTNRPFRLLGPGTISVTSSATFNVNGGISSLDHDLTLSGTVGTSRVGQVESVINLGTGNLIKNGINLWRLGGDNVYTGNTIVNDGVLRIEGPAEVLPDQTTIVMNGGIIEFHGSDESVAGLQGNSASAEVRRGVAGNFLLTLSRSSGNSTYNGTIVDGANGTMGIVKAGGYTQRFGGVNTYTGATIINGGLLKAESTTFIGSSTAVTLANVAGAELDITGFNTTIGSLSGGGSTGGLVRLGTALLSLGDATDFTYSGEILGQGTAGIIKQGTGIFTLAGNPNYEGVTLINNGTLRAGDNLSFSGTVSISTNGRFDCASQNSTTLYLSFNDVRQIGGTWGSTNGVGTIPATQSNTYFTVASTGNLQVVDGIERGYWLGGTSTNWFTASNWYDNFIPDDTTNVVIECNACFQPNINASAEARDIIIFLGASLSISGSNQLDVYGDWLNNGSFTPNTSLINFRKSSGLVRVVSRPDIAPFYDIEFTGSGTMQIATNSAQPFTMGGAFITQNGGTIDLNGKSLLTSGFEGNGLVTNGLNFNVEIILSTVAPDRSYTGIIQNGAGTVAIRKQGTATQTFNGNNTFSGGIIIEEGMVVGRNNANALGAGPVTLTGSNPVLMLSHTAGNGLNFGNAVTVNANATIISEVNSSGAGATHSLGALNVNAGSLIINGGTNVTSGIAGINFGVATHTVAVNYQVNNPTNGGTSQLSLGGINGATATVTFSGNGDFVQTGPFNIAPPSAQNALHITTTGTTTLSQNNTMSERLQIDAGTFVATGNANAMGNATTVFLNIPQLILRNNTGLAFNNPVSLQQNATIISDLITAGAGVTHSLGNISLLSPTLQLRLSAGANVTSGLAGVSTGTVAMSANNSLYEVDTNCVLSFAGFTSNNTFSKIGTGQLTVRGSDGTRSGGTITLTEGILRLEGANALGTSLTAVLNLDGGQLQLANNTNTVFNGCQTLTRAAASIMIDRTSGSATAMTHTVNRVQTTTGNHTLSLVRGPNITGTATGTLGMNTLNQNHESVYQVDADARMELPSFTSTQIINFEGAGDVVQAPGSVWAGSNSRPVYNGTGRLILSEANTYAGITTINNGTLLIQNTPQTFTGGLFINAPGRMNPNGLNSAAYRVDLDGQRQGPRTFGAVGSGAITESDVLFTPGSSGLLALKGYFQFVDQPVGGRSGLSLAQNPVLEIRDSLGFLLNNAVHNVEILASLGSTDALNIGFLDGDTLVAAINGVVTFDSLRLGGRVDSNYTIIFSADSLFILPIESNILKVSAGPLSPTISTLIASPDSVRANGVATVVVTVTLQDAQTNTLTNEIVTLFTDSNQILNISPGIGAVSDANGQASFSINTTVADSVNFRVQAISEGDTFLTDDIAKVYFFPGPPADLFFQNPPITTTVDVAFSPPITVIVRDSFQNKVWSSSNQVSIALSPSAPLNGTTTVTEQGGFAVFPLVSIPNGGTYQMVASSAPLANVNSLSFDVIENFYLGGNGDGHDMQFGRLQNLEGRFVVSLTGSFLAGDKVFDGTTIVPAGSILQNDVVLDQPDPAFPNVQVDTITYRFRSPGVGRNRALIIDSISVSGSDTAEYIVRLNTATLGSANILGPSHFGGAGRGDVQAQSDTLFLDGIKAVPNRLVLLSQSADQLANTPFGLKAQIVSADDRRVPFGAGDASLSLFTNPTSATLSGSLSQSFTAGEAVFADLSINRGGQGYQLTLEPGSLTHALDSIVTPPFDVYAVYSGGNGRGDTSRLIASRGLDGLLYQGWIGGAPGNPNNWYVADNWSSGELPDDSSRIIIVNRLHLPRLIRSATPALNSFNLASNGALFLNDGALLQIDSGTTGASAADGPLFRIQNGAEVETRGNSRIVIEPNARYINLSESQPTLEVRQRITGTKGWRQLAAPVRTTYQDWLDSLETQGYTGAKYDSLQPNVLWFAETDTGTTLQSWRKPTNATDSVLLGRGHFVYVFNGAGWPASVAGSGAYSDTLPKVLTATGREPNLSSGPFTFPELTFTPRSLSTVADTAGGNTFFLDENIADEGWNLLGNPTASVLHWDEAGAWTKTNLNNTIYIWDPNFGNGTGGYRYWNGDIGNIDDTTLEAGLLAPYQAFWVHANAANPALSFTNAAKSTQSQPYISRTAGSLPNISFEINGQGMKANSFVSFGPQAITGPDRFDAYQLESYNDDWLMLYTKSSPQHRKPLVINHLPDQLNEELAIPLHLSAARNRLPISGSYALKWKLSDNWPANWAVALMDHHQQKVVTMIDKTSYSFNYNAPVSPTARSSGDQSSEFRSPKAVLHQAGNGSNNMPMLRQQREPQRPFTIVIIPNHDGGPISYRPDHPYLYPPTPNPFVHETTLAFYLPQNGDVMIEVSDMQGRLISRQPKSWYPAGTHELNWSASQLSPGTYLLRLITDDFVSTQKAVRVR